MTEIYPPLNFEKKDKLMGISIDLMMLLLEKLGSKLTLADIQVLPWSKAYQRLQNIKNTCLFSTTKNKEREKLFKWVGPIIKSKNVILCKKESNISILSSNDIKKHRIGVVISDIAEQLLIQAELNTNNLVRFAGIHAIKDIISALNSKQIDAWAVSEMAAKWILKKHGFNPNNFKSIYVLNEGDNDYFAFHIDTPDKVIQQFQIALDELKKEGKYQKVIDKYLGEPVIEEIWVLSEEYKPYQYVDQEGNITGFGIELVTLMFKEAKIPIKNKKIYIMPWLRAYSKIMNEKNSAAFMTARKTDRENLFKWVGPLTSRKMWLFKLKARDDINLDIIEDAQAYKLGGYKSAQTEYLEKLGFTKIYYSYQESDNIKHLLSGVVDLIPSLEMTIKSRLKDLDLSPDTVEKAILFDNRFDFYLAINKKTSDLIVQRLQKSLDKLKQNGIYSKLEAKYIN